MTTVKKQTIIREKIVIDNAVAFEAWEKSLKRFDSRSDLKSYVFDMPEYSFYENLNITTEVDHYNSACGCKTGSFVMSMTFLVMICNFFISGGSFSQLTLYKILAFSGVVLLGALTGKMLGLLHARWNLIKIARMMNKRRIAMYGLKQIKMT